MIYVVALMVSIVCALVAYVTLDKSITDKIPMLAGKESDSVFESKRIERIGVLLAVIVLMVVSFAVMLKVLFNTADWINIVKMITALVCLCGAACVDYREHRIPNIFPLILALVGVMCLAVGYFTSQEGAISYVVSSVFAALGCTFGLTMASVLTRQGIGAGDIKLLASLAIVGGVYMICGTLFFSVLLCAIAAILFLVFKKKTLDSSLPFGPFILVGYVISVFASIY